MPKMKLTIFPLDCIMVELHVQSNIKRYKICINKQQIVLNLRRSNHPLKLTPTNEMMHLHKFNGDVYKYNGSLK